MSNALWFVLVGSLMLATGLISHHIRRLPFTSAILYLAVGMLIGPTFLNAFHFNPLKESALLEILTEVAVLISLFAAGVKMPVPVKLAVWRTPITLAFLSMALTVGMVALFAHYLLGLPLGLAVLLGAIIAPTDPVLATDVQIRRPGDRNRLRFNLTCEAGMNDGSAFPFVMLGLGLLGLHDIGEQGLRWLLVDLAWATAAGVGVGIVLGSGLARVVARLRAAGKGHRLLNDFLGLGLIALVYGVTELIEGWGFLAVFFAAVALRQTETRLLGAPPDKATELHAEPPPEAEADPQAAATVSEGSLVFKEHLERLSELILVLLVGGSLFLDSWSWRAVSLAAFLFLVARPVSVLVGLTLSRTPWRLRRLIAWFGVRGIGSLYYLMYAIQHGLPEDMALELIHLVLVVVSLSILVHGISVRPLLAEQERP